MGNLCSVVVDEVRVCSPPREGEWSTDTHTQARWRQAAARSQPQPCLHRQLAVRGVAKLGRVEPIGMLDPEVRSQGIDSTVGRRTVRAEGALGRMRMEVVPSVGDLLAARAAAPGRARLPRRREHVMVGHLMVQLIMRVVRQIGTVGRRDKTGW